MPFAPTLAALVIAAVSPTGPNRQPQLAVSKDVVALVFGSGDAIWFTSSADAGRSFTAPVKIGELPRLLLGRHRGPRVAIAGGAILVTAISGDLYAWRSTDGGRTWPPPAVIDDRALAAEEGLDALAADDEGHVAVAWLDDRTKKGKRLYGAFSSDAGATWSKNTLLYESPSGTICECCHPSLASLGRGEFAVMWRNAVAGARDMYVMRVRDGRPVSEPVKAGEGTWKLDACPMDGGGLAVAQGKILTAFRRERTVYRAEPGAPEIRIAEGQDPSLAAGAKGSAVVWSSGPAVWAQAGQGTKPLTLSPAGAFPVVVALPDGSFLAAWEENAAIDTRRF